MSNTKYAYNVGFFTITAKSNLHVGAGGENFWIIDNLIQRDAATNFPCINSSSLKGALREYMKHYLITNNDPKDKAWLKKLYDIFGRDKSDAKEDLDSEVIDSEVLNEKKLDKNKLSYPGTFRFLQADLLSIPTLKEGVVYQHATCEWLKSNFRDQLNMFNVETTVPDNDLFGTSFETKQVQDFVNDVDDFNLPVIARNHLTDGSSDNLWYEQVLPRETKLFFGVLFQNNESNIKLFDEFKSAITSHPVQIGANASVGYGFCKIDYIPTNFKTVPDEN